MEITAVECVCTWVCACVCVRERERARDRVEMCLQTHLSVCVCAHVYIIYTHRCVALVSAAQCEPPSIRPSDPSCQQTQQNKEACGSASGYRSSLLCSPSAGSHRRRSQFNLLYLTDQELWAAANETGPSPVCRTLNQPTQSPRVQVSTQTHITF